MYRSLILAMLGFSLGGCAVYDYGGYSEPPRYVGSYGVQRYEVYPAPVYHYGYGGRPYGAVRYYSPPPPPRYYLPPPPPRAPGWAPGYWGGGRYRPLPPAYGPGRPGLPPGYHGPARPPVHGMPMHR
ncbi:hypothetical protein [Pseudomonas sp. RIT-PI-AD]|uniref:hypothetical protein n=1 Tax=Pseudomonas sp. RIT-PI-AD TaxID=3035294 RepID=UPI0021D8AB9D|nr:hypothetical protein [Pseudomonas sp. RIT-PI-AD]